ncbi:uncharacterized protein G2W53_042909 [Senna tora]|uniref:Uncharacterized protein n=1 Tax=Senna tora TaxID=362788 RepID=A0A834SGS3_9FABA|nr:uncharacterized protein G2W53_042909 [Senna tora]
MWRYEGAQTSQKTPQSAREGFVREKEM